MTNTNHFTALEFTPDVQRAQTLTLDVVDGPGDFKAAWTEGHRWTIVPVESADHFDETDVKRLVTAFRKTGHYEVFAIATEPIENMPICYKVSTTEEGLRTLNEAARNFPFVLIPKDRSCAVLCTKDDYYLVAGPHSFVTLTLSKSIADARADFLKFAMDSPHVSMREGLLSIAKRYEHAGPPEIPHASSRKVLLPPG